MIKKLIMLLLILPTLAWANGMESILNNENVFCGCILRCSVNDPITIGWTHDSADGYELKIVHYFYDGLETEIIETTDKTYIINNFPKSSRHFEVQLRAFVNKPDDIREYSIWISSSDEEHSSFNDVPCGWLLYTTPEAPSW